MNETQAKLKLGQALAELKLQGVPICSYGYNYRLAILLLVTDAMPRYVEVRWSVWRRVVEAYRAARKELFRREVEVPVTPV